MTLSSLPFSRFIQWLHRVLYEECDDPQAPKRFQSKARKMLHNQTLIQVCMVATWILPFMFIPLVIILIQIPYFPLVYVVWCSVTGLIWAGLLKRERMREHKSGSDLAREYSTKV
jgi:archaellum biogenesis protein FlaJ (TadC family)